MRTVALAAILLTLVFALDACGYGHSIQRSADPRRAMVVNLGSNRYVYSVTRTVALPAQPTPASPILTAPEGSLREVGIINVQAEFSGSGSGGLRRSDSEFYSELGGLAAELGATRFQIVNRTVQHGYLSALAVSVLAP